MSQQLTQCPHCQTSFRVTAGQLAAAGGLVRCGACLGLFSAAINAIRVKPDDSDDILLGDLDIDAPPLMDAVDDEELEDDTELLFADPRPQGWATQDAYAPYEEYEDNPDLFAAQETHSGQELTTPEPADPDLTWSRGEAADMAANDTDPFDRLPPAVDGPSEEFDPPAILFDDDDDEHDVDDTAVTLEPAQPLSPATENIDTREDGDDATLDMELSDGEMSDGDYDSGPDPDADLHTDPADELRLEPSFGELDEASAILDEYLDQYTDDVEPPAQAAVPTHRRDDGKPAWLQRPGHLSPDKAALHDYLATLEDEEDLDPLAPDQLDGLAEEPVLLAADARRRGLLATVAGSLLALLLMTTLLLQFVDRHLDALRQRSAFARFEPLACALLNCPPAAAPAPLAASAALQSQELLVRSHPRIRGALELSFVFRNDAAAAAPFPALELSFRDEQERLLANRLLLPADYLPPELRSLDAMPGHSSVQVNLELLDPGAAAVNYSIAFRDL